MKARLLVFSVAAVSAVAIAAVPSGRAQSQEPDAGQEPSGPPIVMQGGPEGSQGVWQGRGRPIFGKITGIQGDSIEIADQDGTKSLVKLTSSTEFRKDRQPAKIGDFKVGDMVIVRTNQESGNTSWATALMVAAAPQGMITRGGEGLLAGMHGTIGKDYVVGEVKSVDPPKLTVLRVDNVTQTLELNEETSLRRGRESITVADIQPGDHIFARGAAANDVFVPKGLTVIPPEQWKRMKEMNAEGGPGGAKPRTTTPPTQQKPPEQPN